MDIKEIGAFRGQKMGNRTKFIITKLMKRFTSAAFGKVIVTHRTSFEAHWVLKLERTTFKGY
jgi:hypothetical protein